MVQRKVSGYGWKPQLLDHRDLKWRAPLSIGALPESVDLRSSPFTPPVYDQGDIGSCTGNSTAACVQFLRRKESLPDFTPARLFLYWNGRNYEGSTGTDSGAMLRDVIKGVNQYGAPSEDEWPYNDADVLTQPPQNVYDDAKKDVALMYEAIVPTVWNLRAALTTGVPFVFGFTVYESFESPQVASTGVAPMPSADDTPIGGHAVAAWGYDNDQRTFLVRNSWGPNWGMGGYFTLPYDYITTLAADFWQINAVGQATQ